MNILVSAAALRTSGARTIYRQFINHLRTRVDGNHYYVIVDKDMERPEMTDVEYWVVDISNKLKRCGFELWGFKRLLDAKNIKFDIVVSLQNLGVKQLKVLPQIIYYHQPLPFFNYKWHIYKRKELVMWLYKRLYPSLVRRSIGKNVEFVAQLPSIKQGIVVKYGIEASHVHVLFPDLESLNAEEIRPYPFDNTHTHFVFPATSAPYKGHAFLLKVMAWIKMHDAEAAKKIRLHFTLKYTDEKQLLTLIQAYGIEKNIVWHGVIPHAKLLSMYASSKGLLFPSVIETLGLPLIECARFGCPIFACDLQYAHEVLAQYQGVHFLPSRSIAHWGKALIAAVNDKSQNHFTPLQPQAHSSWEDFFDIITQKAAAK